MILAAGLGRRMRPLSAACHKTLLPVAGRPILDHIFSALRACEVHHVVLVTGDRGEEVAAAARHLAGGLSVEVVHNPRFAETNNIVSLDMALEAIGADRDILLIEGDLVFGAAALHRLLAAPHPDVALLDAYAPGMDGTVVDVEDGVITAVHPPHKQGPRFERRGRFKTLNVYRFSADFCRSAFRALVRWYAQAMNENAYYEVVLGILVYLGRANIHAVRLEGEPWAEIDDPVDLEVAEFIFDPPSRARRLAAGHGGRWSLPVTDHAFLQNPFFPPPSLIADLRSNLPALVSGYGSAQAVLDRKLGWLLGGDPDRTVALHGASQAFPFLARRFAGRRALVPRPTFGEFARAFPEAETFLDAPGVDLEALEAAVARADVVALVQPNNPTGTLLPPDQVRRWVEAQPGTTFLIDESLAGFAEPPAASWIGAATPHNVVVLVSLGKRLGMPGLRLGGLYAGDPGLAAELRAELPVWNLSAPAEYTLELVLKYRGELDETLARSRVEARRVADALAALPRVVGVWSGGCFVLAATSVDPKAAVAHLVEVDGLWVKDLTGRLPGRGWLRLGLRTPAENDHLLERLGARLAETPSDGEG